MFLPGSSTVGDRRYDVWTESVDPAFDIYRILDTTIAGAHVRLMGALHRVNHLKRAWPPVGVFPSSSSAVKCCGVNRTFPETQKFPLYHFDRADVKAAIHVSAGVGWAE
jgi:hypothetical protein